MTFKDCKNAGSCGKDLCLPEFCHQFDRIQLTNADRIRAMSDEELGKFLGEWAEKPLAWKCDGEGECLAWLQEPAEKPKEG